MSTTYVFAVARSSAEAELNTNVLQFFFIDAQALASNGSIGSNDIAHTTGKHKDLYSTLLKDFDYFSRSPDKLDYDSLAVSNVAPSVVPNPYLPSFRIYAYNTTGSKYVAKSSVVEATIAVDDSDDDGGHQPHRLGDFVDRETWCHGGSSDKPASSWRCKLDSPWHSSPHSPSRTNRLYTPLGFAQVS